jgi:2,4-dienoyl-CoA reductase-like NADH-dependent reductase (Old Yellow Enzyme family)
MSSLLTPVRLGAIELANRIVMAPLTRTRASGPDGRTPNQLMKEYYVQRAGAGLIISEATAVTPMGVGYPRTPGIWSEEHVKHWKTITDAVHAKGGKIILQLWHVGRVSDPIYLDGETPVSSSAIAQPGHVSLARPPRDYPTPRALGTDEIPSIIAAYRAGAENAKRAGFDGVEVPGANGYLPDQFLQDGANTRTDRYGGVVENRARFLLEVTDAAIAVWGADRVGVHLSPRPSDKIRDSDPKATFGHVARELGRRKIAFLCTREYEGPDSITPLLKAEFGGPVIGNEKYTLRSAEAALARGDLDAVAFGQDFIANPDLVRRYELNAPLNKPNPMTYYAEAHVGYTDYPFLD